MKFKLGELIVIWLVLRKWQPLEGGRYTIENPITFILKKEGKVKLSDGFSIPYDKENKKQIINLIGFVLLNGIRFGDKDNQWKLYPKEGIIETHQGIKFKINVVGLLDETFLNQIHFTGFDLKDKIVVTAGAYIGDTPLFYSYYGAKVYAFEPDPNSYNLALENIKLNPDLSNKIILKNYAIGKDEEIDFPVGIEDSGGSSIYVKGDQNTVRVKSISISTLIKDFNLMNPFLLDLDIKGSEFDVIQDDSIMSFQKVRIEYSPYLIKSQTKGLEDLINILKGYGFSKFRIYKHNCHWRFDLMNHGTIEAEK